MSDDYEYKWFVVKIKPNSYDKAQRNLKQQGFKTFLPTLEVKKKNSNKFLNNSVHLFPGYIFVAFNPLATPWSKINNTYGVSNILTFNGKPGKVSSDLILDLKARCDSSDRLLHTEQLEKGDKIKILTGPFSNFIAKIENTNAEDRICALMDFMGQTLRLQLNYDNKLGYEKL